MKLLLIMPKFFNYPEFIIEELKLMGYEVDFFDDRPSTNAFIKALIRLNKNLINIYIKKYFSKMMDTVNSKKYDVVLVISGQSLSFSEDMFAELKSSQSQAKFVLYQWDSQKNFPYIEKFQHFFDKCYSFDRLDAQNNKRLTFLPLFYAKKFEALGSINFQEFVYDFCFVGTAHPKKYKFISIISNQLQKIYSKQFIYYYFPSRIVYIYRKVRNKEFRRARYNEFHFEPLSNEIFNEIYNTSRCILDSPQDNQVGLTIRVIEALGAKKKLITTNEDVINYDFYREENIYIYNGKFDLDNIFFNSEYSEIENEIYEKYSLRHWLKVILEE